MMSCCPHHSDHRKIQRSIEWACAAFHKWDNGKARKGWWRKYAIELQQCAHLPDTCTITCCNRAVHEGIVARLSAQGHHCARDTVSAVRLGAPTFFRVHVSKQRRTSFNSRTSTLYAPF